MAFARLSDGGDDLIQRELGARMCSIHGVLFILFGNLVFSGSKSDIWTTYIFSKSQVSFEVAFARLSVCGDALAQREMATRMYFLSA